MTESKIILASGIGSMRRAMLVAGIAGTVLTHAPSLSFAGIDCISAGKSGSSKSKTSATSSSIVLPPLPSYRMRFVPPDYMDADSVEKHLVYSRIWGALIEDQLGSATHGSCSAIVLPMIFPDLFVGLLPSDQTTSDAECMRQLQLVVQADVPTSAKIIQASNAIMDDFKKKPSRGGYFEVSYIFEKALREVYSNRSTMNTLMSVDAHSFSSIDPKKFLYWFNEQRNSNQITIVKIPVCEDGALSTETPNEHAEIPQSPLVKSDVITLRLTPEETPAGITGLLLLPVSSRRVIGGGVPLQPESDSVGRYCNVRQKFPVPGQPDSLRDLRIGCLHQSPFGWPWVIFFCDSKDSTSPEDVSSALNTIRGGIEASGEAVRLANGREPRGPYLVNIQSVKN